MLYDFQLPVSRHSEVSVLILLELKRPPRGEEACYEVRSGSPSYLS